MIFISDSHWYPLNHCLIINDGVNLIFIAKKNGSPGTGNSSLYWYEVFTVSCPFVMIIMRIYIRRGQGIFRIFFINETLTKEVILIINKSITKERLGFLWIC